MRDRAIGIFDSGLGGLTVARQVRALFPHEKIIYLGDTARVPYGTRSADTVIRYAQACSRHLLKHHVKILVVACNTVSAVALEYLRDELDIPVLGVIEPGARAGFSASQTKRVGVIATQGTVRSQAYERALHAIDSSVEVFTQAAPLLVPLAEEGWLDGQVPELVCEHYLQSLSEKSIDALILGCTHYPLLVNVLKKVAFRISGPSLSIVDSAEATALELKTLLLERNLCTTHISQGDFQIEVTDLPGRFAEVASLFLGQTLDGLKVEQVDL